MAGWLERSRIRRHVHFSKNFQEIALIFIAVCAVVRESFAQSQGFLSIDCGNTVANFTDINQLQWVVDDGTYIKTGNSSEQLFLNSSIGENLRSFRFFPEGRNKYCYELPTVDPQELSYLFRASFYMNESVLKAARPLEFIISIDGTDWFTVQSGDDSQTSLWIVQEGIFYPLHDITFFCLRAVVGVPFISSLEVRSLLKNSMYGYSSSKTQYLSLFSRYNVGVNSTAPDVRYPADIFDRIWKTPEPSMADVLPRISIPEAQFNQTSAYPNDYFIPSKVMQDAWVMESYSSPQSVVTLGVFQYGPQLKLNPSGQYMLVIVYAQDLNRTISKFQHTVFITIKSPPSDASNGLNLLDSTSGTGLGTYTSSGITLLQTPFFFAESSFINISVALCSSNSTLSGTGSGACNDHDQGRFPNINALEIYGQYDFNFSKTNQADDQVITVLKTVFSLADWQGDPCVPVPHDWLSCALRLTQKFPRCYVTSINIANSGISGVMVNVTATPDIRLNNLKEMSITRSRVDDPTFQLLMNYSSSVLSILNLSYNALSSLPTRLENTTESLVVLDLSHNQLQGQVSSLDKWVQRNSLWLQELYLNDNKLGGIFSSSLYFSSLPNLTVVNLDQNSIQGTLNLSAWYAALEEVSKRTANKGSTSNVILQLFSFVNNNISTIIPSVETFGSTVQNLLFQNKHHGILLGGNPYCKDAQSYIHQYLCRSTINDLIKDDTKKNNNLLIIGTSTGAAIVLLISTAFAIILWRLWKQVLSLRQIQKALADRKVQPPFYQYSDLKSATRDFHKDSKLGSGGFGIVYREF